MNNAMLNRINFDMVYRMARDKVFENKVPHPTRHQLKNDYVFDEEKSIKWNREKVVDFNAEVIKELKIYEAGEKEANIFFKNCLKYAIMNNTGLTLEKASIILEEADTKSEYDTCESIIDYTKDICFLIKKIME